MNQPTIAAISTPNGSGGIGVVRLSGIEALDIACALFRHSSGKKICKSGFESHRLYYGHIIDDEGESVVDEVLLAVMKAPRSYTREDVVEIQAHSGRAVMRRILDLVLKKGAVSAEPGEFTKRAFLNGRIDLTQAEAVIDIIAAATSMSLKIASSQITGNMRRMITGVRNRLIDVLAEIEAEIDFSEDLGESGADFRSLAGTLETHVIPPVAELIRRHEGAGSLRDGLKTAVAGKPNVGKSSLLNALLGKDYAIVTDIPGTTRDLIEAPFDIHGVQVILTDTAGIRESNHPVERIGVEKTENCIRNADLTLFVMDGSMPLTEEDGRIYRMVCDKPHILVFNKSDLYKSDHPADFPDTWRKAPDISVSALYGDGIAELGDLIRRTVLTEDFEAPGVLVPNARHRAALEKCRNAAAAAHEHIVAGDVSVAQAAIELREAIDALDEITGDKVGEAVLDTIFNRFCIGK